MPDFTATQTIERVWDAPVALVWSLWTTPEGFASWHGPPGYETQVQRYELKPGGVLAYTMRVTSPEAIARFEAAGRPPEWGAEGAIVEVEPPKRLVFDLFVPGQPERTMRHTVTLEETADGVRMRLVLAAADAAIFGPAAQGYEMSFDRMAAQLA